jgi:threonine/homoserine/homoserine lactone efflux protein
MNALAYFMIFGGAAVAFTGWQILRERRAEQESNR